MVKGLSRRVIVVDSPDPHIFEQAIFIVRNDAAVGSGGVTSQQVVDQAKVHNLPEERVIREVILAAQPTKRFIEADEVAAFAVFLCSEAARSVTGSAQLIDGAWTAR